MEPVQRPASTRRANALAAAAAGLVLFVAPSVAQAALVDDVIQSVTPSATPDVVGTVNDTIDEVTGGGAGGGGTDVTDAGGTIDDVTGEVGGLLDGAQGGGVPGPGSQPGSGGGSGSGEGSNGTGDASTGGNAGGATKSARGGDGETTYIKVPQAGAEGTEVSDAEAPYGTVAVRGAVATAQRVAALAGPMAAPLLLGTIALIALAGIARGSTGLIKVEDGAPKQTFRL